MQKSMPRKRILYAIQGTGNGHVARAREIVPILQKYGELDLLLSGDQSEVSLDHPIRYRLKGLTFLYNRQGGISYWRTLWKNNLFQLWKDIRSLSVQDYDLVINDFEFTSAWACRWRRKKCYALGHQAAFRSARVPRPSKRSALGEFILKWYAPAQQGIGFHFDHFDHAVFPPVIRTEVRQLRPTQAGHYTVYLPAYGDEELEKELGKYQHISWQVFSKFAREKQQIGSVQIAPINNADFLQSLASCQGLLTSAGFEGPTEALYLGKKLCVIPIKGQYEQSCNAAGLAALGIVVLHDLNDPKLEDWLEQPAAAAMQVPDQTEALIKRYILAPAGF